MKKNIIILVLAVLITLTFCLVGCNTGDPIDFSVQSLVIKGTITPHNADVHSAHILNNKEELIYYLDTRHLDHSSSDIELYDENFFEENILIAVRHNVYNSEKYSFKKVSVKGTKINVTLKRKYSDEYYSEIRHNFIKVKRSDVQDCTTAVVLTETTKIDFTIVYWNG